MILIVFLIYFMLGSFLNLAVYNSNQWAFVAGSLAQVSAYHEWPLNGTLLALAAHGSAGWKLDESAVDRHLAGEQMHLEYPRIVVDASPRRQFQGYATSEVHSLAMGRS